MPLQAPWWRFRSHDRGSGRWSVELARRATLVRHGAGGLALASSDEGQHRALTRAPTPRALGMELASAHAALIALGRLTAALASSLAGALMTAILPCSGRTACTPGPARGTGHCRKRRADPFAGGMAARAGNHAGTTGLR